MVKLAVCTEGWSCAIVTQCRLTSTAHFVPLALCGLVCQSIVRSISHPDENKGLRPQ